MKAPLRRGLRRLLRNRLSAWATAGALIPLAVFGVASSENGYHAYPMLKAAYASDLTTSGLQPTPLAAAAAIHRFHPDYTVLVADGHQDAYRLVRADHGGPVVAVVAADRSHVELIGRLSAWYSAVVELDGTAQTSSIRDLWIGQMQWGRYLDVLAGEGALGLLLLGLLPGLRLRRKRRAASNARREQEEILTRWREIVPADGVYGPLAPAERFEIWVADFDEHEQGSIRATFKARPYLWRDEKWSLCPSVKPPSAFSDVKVTSEMALVEISSAWSDFCHAVAAHNAEQWAAKRRLAEAAATEQEAKQSALRAEAERLELERGGSLKDLLTPGTEMVRGLVPERH